MEHDFTPEDAAPWPDKADKPAADIFPEPAPAPDAAEPPARSRVELVVGGVVVLLTAAGTLALLMTREHAPSAVVAASTPSAMADTSAKRSASTTWIERAPRWTANPDAWLGRSKGVAYEVSAAEPVGIWMRAVRPALVVRCTGGRTDVFVFTDSAATIEPNTDDHTVEYGFDDEPMMSVRWPDGAEHNALFAPDAAGLSARLKQAQTFTFRFSPHNAPRATARFNTGGLEALLAPAGKVCGS